MSKPISYAITQLEDQLAARGITITRTAAREITSAVVQEFLKDAQSECRFDNKAIVSLLADIS